MQRTQIYFEQETLQELKSIARNLNISVSEFIRRVINQEIKKKKSHNLNDFLENMKPLDSFKDIDATKYVQDIRGRSRLFDD